MTDYAIRLPLHAKLIPAIFAFMLLFHVSQSLAAEAVQPATQPQQEVQKEGVTPQTQYVKLDKEYFKGYLTDTGDILTSPWRWNSSDWIQAAVVTGITIGLYTQDDQIKAWVKKNKNTTSTNISDDAKKLGLYSIVAVGGLGLYGYVAKDEKAVETFLLSTESFVITGAFAQILKRTTGRHRPNTGDPHDTWEGPTSEGDFMSFPSGDASSAFAIASVVASEYDNKIVPPVVYTAASLIGLSRIHANAHWSSDVFLGSAIGYFVGKSIVSHHSDHKMSALSIAPFIDGKDTGLLLTYRY